MVPSNATKKSHPKDIARTKEAIIPENADGTRIPLITSKDVVPRANPPSFKLLGTDLSASSHRDATIGKIIIPTTIAPLAALNISCHLYTSDAADE